MRSQNSCASSAYFSKSVIINNCPRLAAENSKEILSVNPNPFSLTATLFLPVNTDLTASTIIITDLTGRLFKTIKSPEEYNIALRKSDFSEGIYLVQHFIKGVLEGSVKMVIQ